MKHASILSANAFKIDSCINIIKDSLKKYNIRRCIAPASSLEALRKLDFLISF